jgi:hypothetical protein
MTGTASLRAWPAVDSVRCGWARSATHVGGSVRERENNGARAFTASVMDQSAGERKAVFCLADTVESWTRDETGEARQRHMAVNT